MGKVEEEGELELHRRIADLHVSSQNEIDGEVGEDDEEADELLVGLGFVQPVEQAWKVARHHFPSKVGGCPAWLDPLNLPSGAQSTCGICDSPLEFLLQVYAPVEEQEEAFHRTIFVFICSNMGCLQQDQHHQYKQPVEKPCRSVKIFRSQLARSNPFYAYTPPTGEHDAPSCEGAPLCAWCGTWKGHKACAACKQTSYCSRNHQVEHWRAGHSGFCRQVQAARKASQASEGKSDLTSNSAKHQGVKDVPSGPGPASDKLWPEFELVVDEEDNYVADDGVDGSGNAQNLDTTRSKAQQLLEDYERRRKSGEEFTAADMQDVHEASQELQQWAAFQARIARAPAQVLRYCRSPEARPLWPLLEGQPENTHIPACSHCGSPRTFELQVLPQLLYFLKVKNEPSSLDWGTIAVYSCANSCKVSVSKGYAEEFAWVQLPA